MANKILLLVSAMNSGGAERVASVLVNAWASRGDQVILMPTFSGRGECFYQLSSSVRLVYLADLVSSRQRTWANMGARLLALRRFIAAERPDVIVSFLPNVNVAAIIASIGLKVPIIACERNDPFVIPTSPFWRFACRLMYPSADALMVQTQAVAAKYASSGLKLRRVRIIPNPISEQMINFQRHAGSSAIKRLISVGRLDDQKQFSILIKVFAGLAKRHTDWSLRIMGDGPLRRDLQEQITSLGLEGRVELAGQKNNIEEELAQADAFVLTSKYEGFPNALLEAMTVGLPCVTFDCPSGPREITKDGQVALLVPLNDEHALGMALERIMSDAGLRESLGQQGRASVIERFALDKILEQWDLLFKEIGVKAPLRVVHIITGLNQGGAEAMLVTLLTALHSRCHMHVISFMDEGIHGKMIKEMGISLHCLNSKKGHFSLQAFLRLRDLLREIQPDVVQTWMYHANLIGGLVARMAGCHHVIWGIHNSDLDLKRNKRSTIIVNQICAALSYSVPRSIVNCSANSMKLHCGQGYLERKCVIIPNGFDTRRFNFSDRSIRHEYRIGNVARLDPQKDHRNILHAFSLVLKVYPGCKLILCGSGITNDNVQLQAWIDQYGINDKVELLGPRQDIANILNSLDLFVLGSCGGEAFPLVLGEAMACGVPCVTTDVGDSARIVGDTGWVVPPRDPQALASAVIEALGEPLELHAARRRRCRQRIVENFAIEHVADKYYDLWTEAKT